VDTAVRVDVNAVASAVRDCYDRMINLRTLTCAGAERSCVVDQTLAHPAQLSVSVSDG
jgi:hypothetical protein